MNRLLSSRVYCIRWVQYIPSDMHIFLLYFVLLWLYYQLFEIHVMCLPISFRVTSLALEQSCDCSITSEVTLKKDMGKISDKTLQWRHNGHDGISNHQPHDCLLNRLFGRKSKKTSELCLTGLCVGNSPVTGEFPVQIASKAENVSIWWRHHDSNRDKSRDIL